MDVSETWRQGWLVLTPKGQIDSSTAPAFEKAVVPRAEAGDADLVIDLAQVPYISSAGLRVLLMAAKRIRAAERRIACCNLAPSVARVFDISGFQAVVTIRGTLDEAIAGSG